MMSDERSFGIHETSPEPFLLDSSSPPTWASSSKQKYTREVLENESDAMESLSSDISPHSSSAKGEGHSHDSWSGDDEDSMSDELDSWLRGDSRHQLQKRKEGPSRLYESFPLRRYANEEARMEAPPFLREENQGNRPADEAEILADDFDNTNATSESISPSNRLRFHSDNDISMRAAFPASTNSSVVAYSESDLIGPGATDFAYNSPTVFPSQGSGFSVSRRRCSVSNPHNMSNEENNENVPRKRSDGKRKHSAHSSVKKPPLTLQSKTRLTIRIKKWSLGAVWRWNAGDENCGICRMPFEACCTDCKTPGDDCPLAAGTCKHSFHMHCIVKWTETQNTPRPQCPLCRQEWVFASS